MRGISKYAVALLVVACALFAATSASAKKPKVKVTEVSQGQILEDGKGEVSIKPKKGKKGKGKATVQLTATDPGGKPVKLSKKQKVKLKGKRKTVRPKLTESGREAFSDCVDRKLQAKVSFKPKAGGKKQKAKSKKRAADLTWAPCSVGSEDPIERPYFGPEIPTPNADRCDFLDTSACLYPFPNDFYTAADGSTPTGKRLNIHQDSAIKNVNGVPVDVTDINRNDGYSPGEPITLKVAGVENQTQFDANGLVPVDDPGRYADAAQKVVVINAATGQRHPIFAEVDATADTDANRILYIRPMVNFEEGGRYIVALRGLTDGAGELLGPGLAFRAYRDRLITDIAALENRRPHMENVIQTLQGAGIQRANLDVAWDFTVASEQSQAGRALTIRDDAFERLGDTDLADLTIQGASPDFTIDPDTDPIDPGYNQNTDGVVQFATCDQGTDPIACEAREDDRIDRIVRGKVTVPCYLNQNGCPPGAKFSWNGDELTWNPAFEAEVPFTCTVPRSTDIDTAAGEPARAAIYGHGLLGSRAEVENGSGGNIRDMTNENNFVYCATNWAGFSSDDIGQILLALGDMSNFVQIADRMQQGFVNFLYLGRLMIHPDGLGSDPVFQDTDGDSVIDNSTTPPVARLYYDGNSQGGIMGGALTALAPDFERAVLGVPGMNYSTLLQRSVDFDEYAEIPGAGLYDNYPNLLERPLVFSLVQMMWDRGEANGYAQHMTTDPLPNTPEHQVLLHAAYGDHQVANLTAEIEARTIGAEIMQPALDPGRHWEASPFFNLAPLGPYPYSGSALVYWDGGPFGFNGTIDGGTKPPPDSNVPPRETDGYGDDPHSMPRRTLEARDQKGEFLDNPGSLSGGCAGGDPCYANGFTGAP